MSLTVRKGLLVVVLVSSGACVTRSPGGNAPVYSFDNGVRCAVPAADVVIARRDIEAQANAAGKIVTSAEFSDAAKYERLRQELPQVDTFDRIEFRLCMARGSNSLTAEQYNHALDKILPPYKGGRDDPGETSRILGLQLIETFADTVKVDAKRRTTATQQSNNCHNIDDGDKPGCPSRHTFEISTEDRINRLRNPIIECERDVAGCEWNAPRLRQASFRNDDEGRRIVGTVSVSSHSIPLVMRAVEDVYDEVERDSVVKFWGGLTTGTTIVVRASKSRVARLLITTERGSITLPIGQSTGGLALSSLGPSNGRWAEYNYRIQ